MKKFNIIFLLLSAINLQAQSQTDISSSFNKMAFKVGYYGNIFLDNGLNIGAEYEWKEKTKTKEKKKGPKTITHQLLFNGSLGYSTNFFNQADNGLHTYYGLIWRRTNSKRWQRHIELNPVGYYRSFLPDTYEVKEGEVSKVGFPGRSYYSPSIGFGIGRSAKGKRYAGWYLNFNYALRMPYNAGVLPIYSFQCGYRFDFKKIRNHEKNNSK